MKNVPPYPEVYDAEGVQYRLYADHEVSASKYSFCAKKANGGTHEWWWLRSPGSGIPSGFHGVRLYGDWGYAHADGIRGVSPCFCF